MKKLNFTVIINAPKETVWHKMLDKESYEQWTTAFSEGSTFKGTLEKGSKVLFTDAEGKGGMVSMIEENKPYNFLSIKHIGVLQDGKEDFDSPAAKAWSPAFENYTFTEKDTATQVEISVDVADEFADMFSGMWPKALEKLKEISEA